VHSQGQERTSSNNHERKRNFNTMTEDLGKAQ
jgi:hypothetical protein